MSEFSIFGILLPLVSAGLLCYGWHDRRVASKKNNEHLLLMTAGVAVLAFIALKIGTVILLVVLHLGMDSFERTRKFDNITTIVISIAALFLSWEYANIGGKEVKEGLEKKREEK